MKCFEFLGPVSQKGILTGCVVMAVLIGILRYATGPELSLSLFYLFPVSLAAWKSGKVPGILIACFCALTWLVADLGMQDRFSSPMIPLINELLRLMVFLFVALQVSTMKMVMDAHKKTARTDSLTGIPNRLSFLEYSEFEINKSRRDKRPISLIFLDVDNFKAVNDTKGHHEGDILLSNVAATLSQVIRVTDFAARLGGDEFAVLLWRSGAEDSYQVAMKIKEQLLKLVKRKHWPVTFSLGLVTYEAIPASVHEMVDEADKLMYQAKQKGKNTIVFRTVKNGEGVDLVD
ncbi:MAG: diguanylate cyclase [Proteobacteria bacterium]|nr:diguanylate cyclase [Pseudomonadota bacterium]